MYCLYVAENMTKCPLTRGVRLREVSASGGSTVILVRDYLKRLQFAIKLYAVFVTFIPRARYFYFYFVVLSGHPDNTDTFACSVSHWCPY